MSRTLRTTLWVLGAFVVAMLLFGLGMQIFWMIGGTSAGYGPMMRGAVGMHRFGGAFGFPFLGPVLGLGLVALVVAGAMALFRGARTETAAANCTNCGSSLVAGWAFCPRCGQKV
jgi:hypothetical protein